MGLRLSRVTAAGVLLVGALVATGPAAGADAATTPAPTGVTSAPASTTATAPAPADPEAVYGWPCHPVDFPGGTIRTWSFEDGATDGVTWSRDPLVPTAVTSDVAASGSRSLRVDDLTSAGWVRFTPGAVPHLGWYRVSAKVRLAPGTPPTAVTLTPFVGRYGFGVPGAVRAVADAWTELTAWVRPSYQQGDYSCDGAVRRVQVPMPGLLELRLADRDCGVAAGTVPTGLRLDDVTLTTSSSAGASGPQPTSPPSAASSLTCGTPSPTVSPTVSPSPTPSPVRTCSVGYQVNSQWSGGYSASITVRNLGAAAWPVWTLRWTFPTDQTVTQLWGGTASQSGRSVTVTSPSWGAVPAGGTATVGFLATASGGAVAPTAFTVDGSPCT